MYQLNNRTVDLLERVREKLDTELSELIVVSGTSAGARASAGVGGAENPTDVEDALDMYLDTILERMVNETGKGNDAAVSFIMSKANELASAGDLPAWPGDSASDDEVSVWLGKAKTLGFEYYVLRSAHTGS